jgi:2-ketocyclohexanecarboxyl-CoA hydrolase
MTGIVIEHSGPAVWIRLTAPQRRNAYDPAMAAAITEAVENAAGAHAVVITGSDGRDPPMPAARYRGRQRRRSGRR